MRSVGVEEELLLVDAETGEPRAVSAAVLDTAARETAGEENVFESELQREQVEFATLPQTRMEELAAEIRRNRAEAARHAGDAGAVVAALATSPLPVSPSIAVGRRYHWMAERFGLTLQEQLSCGCHVHVSVDSDEEGVAVLDRIRPWLAVLLALSANSPFWQGQDSCYSSYRSRVWGRWPSAGPTGIFGSAARYHQQVRDMVGTGVLRDEGMVYFDARLSHRYPTVEIRVADVCLDPDATVLHAILVRGLVETAVRQWRAGEPPARHGESVLRLAAWQAARYGLQARLLHPATMRPAPAGPVVRALFDHVRDALDDHGDTQPAQDVLERLLRGGNGAAVQRAILERSGSMRNVVTECARLTHGSCA
ncbi:YbdK family carboxylate-amine ligase [Streptomyces sp. ICN441]|uniref:Putative glutamate--cysteine ligase 2 n=1 Tax=Streptomyces tirandamycinicus TaxID=2174846 RepID=A0A2S1T117_9ACTN|nr:MULTISPECIES: glutamate--cysteine ligase [Streptomyces]AWI32352.1 carboxylate--amine ligase [Streptomyces tirandamycinicus]NNJ07015.1 glutamate--cysteine ligase [Streptomyces sp. PKU-MA01144]TFE51854.1 YbdK family carboxylate-amine ligase [Streptomyces sp. ICN441]